MVAGLLEWRPTFRFVSDSRDDRSSVDFNNQAETERVMRHRGFLPITRPIVVGVDGCVTYTVQIFCDARGFDYAMKNIEKLVDPFWFPFLVDRKVAV